MCDCYVLYRALVEDGRDDMLANGHHAGCYIILMIVQSTLAKCMSYIASTYCIVGIFGKIFNPQCACVGRVMVLVWSVCLSVLLSVCYHEI